MNEQQPITPENKLQNIAEQNKKMRKKLMIALIVTVGIVAILITTLLIVKSCQEKEEPFTLPDSYFYPTYKGDIFAYADYLDKRPDVIFYCEDPDGLGRTTSIDADREDEFTKETLFLRDFLLIMMHADVDAYNNCFNETYYKKNDKKETFSQQMIYEAEIRFASQEDGKKGEKVTTYFLFYKLYENDGSLRRDVGSDAVVPMKVVLRTLPTGEISISEWQTTRTK